MSEMLGIGIARRHDLVCLVLRRRGVPFAFCLPRETFSQFLELAAAVLVGEAPNAHLRVPDQVAVPFTPQHETN